MQYFFTLIFLALTLVEVQHATLELAKHERHFLQLEESLLVQPKQAVSEFCANPSPPPPATFRCRTELLWHTPEGWKSPCTTPSSKRRYPPRYYQLSLACHTGPAPLGRFAFTSRYR